MSFQSGYIQPLWNDATQNQLNALSNLAPGNSGKRVCKDERSLITYNNNIDYNGLGKTN